MGVVLEAVPVSLIVPEWWPEGCGRPFLLSLEEEPRRLRDRLLDDDEDDEDDEEEDLDLDLRRLLLLLLERWRDPRRPRDDERRR